MTTASDWLNVLDGHLTDPGWLSAHEDEVLAAIRDGLNYPPLFHHAAKLLIQVFPHFALLRANTQRWSPLLYDALVAAQDLRDDDLQAQVLTQLGETHLLNGKHPAAHQTFTLALERAQQGDEQELRLAAYIGLIKLQSIYFDGKFQPDFIEQVKDLRRQVSDEFLRAAAHQILATAYSFMEDTRAALGEGQTAYARWRKLDNKHGMADTTLRLAVQYWRIGRLDLADLFLKRAQSYYLATESARQYGLSAYGEGLLAHRREEHNAAEQWFQQALREFQHLNRTYDIAMSHHSLGLAQTGLRKFAEARSNLEIAMQLWESLKNWHELASACQAMGYLEGQAGRQAEALAWLDKALAMCQRIPQMPNRERLERDIRETIREIQGSSTTGTSPVACN